MESHLLRPSRSALRNRSNRHVRRDDQDIWNEAKHKMDGKLRSLESPDDQRTGGDSEAEDL
jgi:hypothetical protein